MAAKNAPKRSKFEIKRDRKNIAALYLKGWSQERIADELKISRDMVQYDVTRIKEDWRQSAVYDFDAAKQKALAELANLKATAWQAWEKSTLQRKRTKQSQTKGKGSGDHQTAEVIQEEQAGDPRFLITIKELIKEECHLLGLYPEALPANDLPQLPGGNASQTQVIEIPAWSPEKPKPE